MNKQLINEFQERAIPLIELINTNFDPFTKIIIEWESASIIEGNILVENKDIVFKISKNK